MRPSAEHLSPFRVRYGPMASDDSLGLSGAFRVFCRTTGRTLQVVSGDGAQWWQEGLPGEPWEHVSVSLAGRYDRCPAWPEMVFVKDLFWAPEELVLQFHPPASVYVHTTGGHVGVLHLWRPLETVVPLPPVACV